MRITLENTLSVTPRITLLFFVTFFLPDISAAAQHYTTTQGHPFEVTLVPDKTEIMLGEPCYLSFEIRNRSDNGLVMSEGGDYRNSLGRPESFSVTVRREDGSKVAQPGAGPSMGGLIGFPTIPANGIHRIRLLLPHWATFAETGDYTITCARTLSIGPDVEVRSPTDYKLESVDVQVTTRIRVKPLDVERLGEVIDGLATSMRQSSGELAVESARALSYISEERAVKHFVEAVDSRDSSVMIEAVRALSASAGDGALEALKRMASSEDEYRRHYAAEALSSSKHLKAAEVLLAMRHDKSPRVRLTVLHALGRMTSEESLTLIGELANDEDELVMKEARRYLAERAGLRSP